MPPSFRRVRVLVLLVCCLLTIPPVFTACELQAQSPEPAFYLDRSHVTLEYGGVERITAQPFYYDSVFDPRDDELLIEARAALNLFVVNKLTPDQLTYGGRAWVLAVTPILHGRILRGFSQPLRSPSFLIKTTAQYYWARKLGDGGDSGSRPTMLTTLTGVWGHHSNGAPGCLFNEEVVSNGDCRVPNGFDESNLTVDPDGSFSTNYLSAALSVARLRFHRASMHEDGEEEPAHIHEHASATVRYEVHPENLSYLFLFSGGADGAFRDLYGAHRLEVEATYEGELDVGKIHGRVAVRGGWQRIFRDRLPSPESSPNIWNAELSYRLDGGFGRGWGPLIRYYKGQDYYNLLFIRDVERLQVGIVIDRSWRGSN